MIKLVLVTSFALMAILGRFKTANDITIAIAMCVVRISFICLRWDLSWAAFETKLGSCDCCGARLVVLFNTFIPFNIRLLSMIRMAIGAVPVVVKGCNYWCIKIRKITEAPFYCHCNMQHCNQLRTINSTYKSLLLTALRYKLIFTYIGFFNSCVWKEEMYSELDRNFFIGTKDLWHTIWMHS